MTRPAAPRRLYGVEEGLRIGWRPTARETRRKVIPTACHCVPPYRIKTMNASQRAHARGEHRIRRERTHSPDHRQGSAASASRHGRRRHARRRSMLGLRGVFPLARRRLGHRHTPMDGARVCFSRRFRRLSVHAPCRSQRKPRGRAKGWPHNESPFAVKLDASRAFARWWVAGSGRNLIAGPVRTSYAVHPRDRYAHFRSQPDLDTSEPLRRRGARDAGADQPRSDGFSASRQQAANDRNAREVQKRCRFRGSSGRSPRLGCRSCDVD